jgi:hypothetical protein
LISVQRGAALVGALLFLSACSGVIGDPSLSPGGARDGSELPNVPTGSTIESLFACDAPTPAPSEARLVRLSGVQYARAVDVLRKGRSSNLNRDRSPGAVSSPFQGPNTADRFTTRATSYFIGEAEVESVLQSATAAAEELAAALTANGASCAAGGFDTDCARSLIAEKAALLFGKPLDDAELETYVALVDDNRVKSLGDEAAVATAMEALLASPSFLFRSELGEPVGDGTFRLTPFEIASALAYTLTDGPPDQELWDAAMDGSLADPDEIEAQVTRLLSSLDQSDVLERFIREYFQYDNVASVAKEIMEFPFHDADALAEDTDAFVREALRQAEGQDLLATLLLADWGFVQNATAESNGYSGSTSGSPEMVWYDSNERVGILTQPSWLVAFSQFDHNDPIRRGKFVREALLCGAIPPIDVSAVPPLVLSEDVPLRESLAEHVSNETCQGCHVLMDPLGLGFEGFDHLGREREMEAGLPVDATGEVTGTSDQDGPYEGTAELMAKLAASDTVRQCFVAHAYEFFRGTPRYQADGCALTDAHAALSDADGDVVAAIAAFFSSDEFLVRVPAEAK